MSAEARIKSRPATGKVAWPCILLEGDEGAGKTWSAYEFTKSEKVGRCFAIDLGEGSADEYASIGNYEVVEHNGTFADLYDQVSAIWDFAAEQLAADQKPVVLTIDTMADEWGVLVDGITGKASRSPANRKKLAEDPAAEVKVPNHLWNDANAKHRRLMTKLLTFPGIVILTSRGKEVAEIRNGSPVEGSKVWKVEGQKNLAFDATAVIRMRRDNVAQLVKARSIHCGVRPGIDAARDMPDDWTLEWFVFDALKVDPATAEVRDLVSITDNGESPDLGEGVPVLEGAQFLATRVVPAWNDRDALNNMISEVTVRGIAEEQVPAPDGSQMPLGDLIVRRVNALAAPTPPATDQQVPSEEDNAA